MLKGNKNTPEQSHHWSLPIPPETTDLLLYPMKTSKPGVL